MCHCHWLQRGKNNLKIALAPLVTKILTVRQGRLTLFLKYRKYSFSFYHSICLSLIKRERFSPCDFWNLVVITLRMIHKCYTSRSQVLAVPFYDTWSQGFTFVTKIKSEILLSNFYCSPVSKVMFLVEINSRFTLGSKLFLPMSVLFSKGLNFERKILSAEAFMLSHLFGSSYSN